ncbi:hypothetical protein F9B85_00050 [Heliorestis acidaminivorans]|uniref:Uncharacterized protein n=1 Tax=Heliorestis acidaminivorans TaxID=553427 RepID=A0A6I0EUU0_9FIRM|nr:hypothetical protein [Heliorestis acidaminivorans]KAB2954134.1 hypothetical protein F9B85_00050 [Heliorestis acidaminivorans]
MNKKVELSQLEHQILSRVDRYFRTRNMTIEEKLFYAKLIVTLDLESGHYSKDQEKSKLELFSSNVDNLRKKLHDQVG